MVLLFLFYISVCIMAIQVSTQSVLLNANEKSIVELQRSVKELAGMERKQRQLLDYYGLHNLNLSESTRRHLDLQNRTITGTQSNETEASCARLAPSNGYGNLKQIMIIFFITLNKYARYGILWHHV
ncbi:hypothetical protein KSF78_0009463 [Schistosoma japonicum]|nr:hypothetical protein KSF78_0009463 [Schistosoma japonicum]